MVRSTSNTQIMHALKSQFLLHLALIVLITFTSCKKTDERKLTRLEKEQITKEIVGVVDNYFKVVQANDIDQILEFWSDSEEFIHAGDGSIVGDYEKWSNWLKDWTNPDRKWLYWNNTDVHVIVLDKMTGTYTMNFDNAFILDGDTMKVKGSWTYVLRKEGVEWKVITSNGTHKGFDY